MAALQEIPRAIEILASPLPPVAEGEALTADQWKVFLSIGDAVIADVQPGKNASAANVKQEEFDVLKAQLQENLPAGIDANAVDAYLSETVTSTPLMKETLHRMVLESLRTDARDGIRMILSTLKYVSVTRIGSIMLTR